MKTKFGLVTTILFIISLLLTVVTFIYAVEFSAFAVGIMKVVIAVGLFWLFDKYAMKSIDTITQLKKGNTAYAIFILTAACLAYA